MQLTVGEIVEGKITTVKDYGVFVDLGEGKSGMVHISEIAQSFVNDIREHVKEGDVVKLRIMNISEDGKISLSIKRATEQKPETPRERKPYTPKSAAPAVDSSYVWTAKKSDSDSFEDMMSKFKQTSDEKFSDLKRKNPDVKRSRRSGGIR